MCRCARAATSLLKAPENSYVPRYRASIPRAAPCPLVDLRPNRTSYLLSRNCTIFPTNAAPSPYLIVTLATHWSKYGDDEHGPPLACTVKGDWRRRRRTGDAWCVYMHDLSPRPAWNALTLTRASSCLDPDTVVCPPFLIAVGALLVSFPSRSRFCLPSQVSYDISPYNRRPTLLVRVLKGARSGTSVRSEMSLRIRAYVGACVPRQDVRGHGSPTSPAQPAVSAAGTGTAQS